VLHLGFPGGQLRSVLAIGCHSDDIEIGCGGTLLRLMEEHPGLSVTWVVLCAKGDRAVEAGGSADDFLVRAGSHEIVLAEFRDGFLPYVGGEVKDFFESLKARLAPDLILTHQRSDLHQDHRLACELTWNTWRDQLVLEYEIPKYDGDMGRPNVYVTLEERIVRRKVDLLLEHFATQRSKRWFTDDLFLSLMRLRGMESNSASRYAEAFYGRKAVF
jgi:LmbE family N-acetylglucosaminyl deacetylase